MTRVHTYDTVVTWTGNRGTGTSGYRHYDRAHEVTADSPAKILGSSDPPFRGDPSRWNPEQLLVAALSQCHMLGYLHQCADAGVVVTGYVDHAHGIMTETGEGGRFTEVVLRPEVSVASSAMVDAAMALHAAAHRACFIASSVNSPSATSPVCRRRPRDLPDAMDGASGDVADQALRLSTAGADRPTDA